MVRASVPEPLTVVTALILERPLCVSCIASKTDTPSASSLETALQRIAHVLTVTREHGRCRSCGLTTTVVSIVARPS